MQTTFATLREAFLAHQQTWLAAYALHEADSGGRAHPEPEHPYRTAFQRDRDRIIHCSAFRRLDYKTQVFVPHEGDHHRTRMTHTLEVAQVARTLARALRLNEDVAEAVALAHDLGHPPFGHAGEAVLNDLMADHGHFEHNRQSLRVVDYLEHPYPLFRGLNLTQAVRRCLAKHSTRYDAPLPGEFDDNLLAPLEGQLVDVADEIAYTSADLFDALSAGWLNVDQLVGLELWDRAWSAAQEQFQAQPPRRDAGETHGRDGDPKRDEPRLGTPAHATNRGRDARDTHGPEAHATSPIHLRIQACRNVMAVMSDDIVAVGWANLQRLSPANASAAQAAPVRCIGFGPSLAGPVERLQRFLLDNVYLRPEALDHDRRTRQVLTELFKAFGDKPELLPERYQSRISAEGAHRVICDYIAGMTDRYCLLEHGRVYLELRSRGE